MQNQPYGWSRQQSLLQISTPPQSNPSQPHLWQYVDDTAEDPHKCLPMALWPLWTLRVATSATAASTEANAPWVGICGGLPQCRPHTAISAVVVIQCMSLQAPSGTGVPDGLLWGVYRSAAVTVAATSHMAGFALQPSDTVCKDINEKMGAISCVRLFINVWFINA